jgi:5-oxoprolinase (ATP-hydrolysing)
MPPSASHIDEEGVMVDNFLLVRDGVFREKELRKLMLDHPYPARNIIERIHDFRAQIAACNRGGTELGRLIKRYGLSLTREYMGFIQDNAEYSVKKALQQFLIKGKAYRRSFEDCLDDGTPVRVTVTIEEGGNPPDSIKAIIDFSGSGNHHLGDNLNAPESVTRSAVLYVLRALVKQDIPLNSGCMRPVDLIIPEGSILRPAYPAPVASGNVETSQRVVDVLLGALGVCAASQGTMNNLLFEVEGGTPYYETIAGGAGAMEGCPGASGVQVHMTNTRITDPEILEFRHSGLRLERFTLRKGSGGRGRFNGGEGVIREIRFLNPAAVSVISERRVHAPYGSNGGEPGKRGVNILQKADGLIRELGHREALNLDRGDLLIIKTPGGGGFGKK